MTQLKRETLAHHTMALIGGFFGLYALFTRGGTFGSSETSNLIYLLVSGLTGSVEDFLIRLGGTEHLCLSAFGWFGGVGHALGEPGTGGVWGFW